MDKVQRQRGSIVLHKEEKNGVDYVRIGYAGNGAIPLLHLTPARTQRYKDLCHISTCVECAQNQDTQSA